jgi:hypothetical protein
MDPNWKSTFDFILLPELKIITHWQTNKFRTRYKCAKESEFEICPRCAVKCFSVHDRRWVTVEDQPIPANSLEVCELRILNTYFPKGSDDIKLLNSSEVFGRISK